MAASRVMEMIEDIPTLGPVTASVRLPRPPTRVFDALTRRRCRRSPTAATGCEIKLPSLHIHAAMVFEGSL